MAGINSEVKFSPGADFEKRAKDARALLETMVIAGAEQLKKEWQNVINDYGLIDSEDMADSVGYNAAAGFKGGGLEIDVYPFGKDYKGVRNAFKAAMHHYGTSTQEMTRFVDEIKRRADRSAAEAIRAVYEEYNRTGQVPHVEQTPFAKKGTTAGAKQRSKVHRKLTQSLYRKKSTKGGK